jgi:hypothetical protein
MSCYFFHLKADLLFIKDNIEEGKETGIRSWIRWNSNINIIPKNVKKNHVVKYT